MYMNNRGHIIQTCIKLTMLLKVSTFNTIPISDLHVRVLVYNILTQNYSGVMLVVTVPMTYF